MIPLSMSGESSFKSPWARKVDFIWRNYLMTYVAPIVGFGFLILTTLQINIITAFLVPFLQYIWILALVFIGIFGYYLVRRYKNVRKHFSVIIVVAVLLVALGLMHVFGIVPLSEITDPTVPVSLGQSAVCPSNANYYGTAGCEANYNVYSNYGGGFYDSATGYGLISQGATFTCSPIYNLQGDEIVSSCFMQYAVPVTSSTEVTTFTESGLPSDYEWYVNYDGMVLSSISSSSITFNTAAGSYSYSVEGISDYAPSPSSGTLNAGSTADIAFTQQVSTPSPSGTISGTFTLNVVGPILNGLASFLYIK